MSSTITKAPRDLRINGTLFPRSLIWFLFPSPRGQAGQADAGVYHLLFLFFLRRSDKPGSRCGHLPSAISLFPSPPRLARKQLRASTIRFFSFSFAAPASREAVAGVYHSLFLFFLRHSDKPGSRCGRLPFAFSLFPSPLRKAGKPMRASTIRFFSFSFAAPASRASSMTDSSLPG